MAKKWGSRKDNNHKDLVRQLRKVPGVSVSDVSELAGLGYDIVVGFKRRNFLIELKNPDRDWALEESEETMSIEWTGQWTVCQTLEQILDLIRTA